MGIDNPESSHETGRSPDSPTVSLSVPPPPDGGTAPYSAVGAGPPPVVPGYAELAEIGRGGMGVVYKARHLKLNRTVALKLVLAGAHASVEDRIRFVREAEAAAGLTHPNVAQVYEVGQHDGLPYLALEYAPGGSLADRLAVAPLPPRDAAAMAAALARAVGAAHDKGVIHRDVKPANVLLAADGAPKLADFGVAKFGDSGITITGAVFGTPSYMAPEQAAGQSKRVGPAADVYALGAVLYECLTGRPPFKAATTAETIVQVLRQDPAPVRALNPQVPRDLETISMKCLQKEPGKRYPSAAALADDLDRFLAGQPITARPVSRLERGWKWVRRNPTPAALWAGLALVLVAGAGVSAWQAVRATQEATRAERVAREQRRTLYTQGIVLASQELAEGNPTEAAARLDGCPEEHRGWEWRYLKGRSLGYGLPPLQCGKGVWAISVSPDGTRIAAACIDGVVHVWDAATGTEAGSFAGHKGVFGLTREVPVLGVAFAPDGKRVASGDALGRIMVWEPGATRPLFTMTHGSEPGAFVTTVRYSPDGRLIATSCWDGTAKVWDAADGKLRHTLRGHAGEVNGLDFRPDGRSLATAGFDRTVRLWDPETGEQTGMLTGHTSAVRDVNFGPPGSGLLVSASWDGTVRVWDLASSQAVKVLEGHNSPVLGASFSPDGRRLATGGFDNTIKLWDTANWQELLTLRGHGDMVWGLVWGPGGDLLVSSSFDKTVRVWDATPHDDPHADPGSVTLSGGQRLNCVAFAADGRLAFGGWGGTIHVRRPDTADGALTLRRDGGYGEVWGVAFDPAGEHLAAASWDKTVRVFDARSGRLLREMAPGPDGDPKVALLAHAVAYSPDGAQLVATDWSGGVTVWDTKTWKKVQTRYHAFGYPTYGLAFSPSGELLATGSGNRTAAVWDPRTGKKLGETPAHGAAVHGVALGPKGKLLATACWDGTVHVWEVDRLRQRGAAPEGRTLTGHRDRVNAVAFSPDGRWLASASEDKTVKLWDLTRPTAPPRTYQHRKPVWGAAFSPDGKRLATAGWDETLMVWTVAE